MKKLYIYLIIVLLAMPWLRAQEQVTVTVSKLVSPLPSSPFCYVENPLKYFSVTITNLGDPVDVYLTCEFRYNGHRIIYSQDTNVLFPRMTLANGINVLGRADYDAQFGGRIGYDLSYFTDQFGEDLMNQISALTRMPEGDYEFLLSVHLYPADGTTPAPIFGEPAAEAFEILYSATAPELITPLSEQVNWGANARTDSRDRTRRADTKTTKREDDFGLLTSMGRTSSNRSSLTPQRKLTFRWTPVVTSSGASPQFDYTLKIVAVMPNQNAQDAIDHNPVVVSTSTRSTYCIIDTLQDMKYQFEQGSTYAVQVKAELADQNRRGSAFSELEYIEVANGGKSQVVTFSWGRAKYSISYNEIKAPLDTAWVELRYHDNIQQLLRETQLHQIVSPSDVVSPDTFDIAFSRPGWTPVTGPSINGVQYTARIYNYMGENECTLHQQPISDASQMEAGRYYYLDVEADINYHYSWDSIRATVHYVNGIEADTEADTVRGERDGCVVRHTGKVFLYGTKADKRYATKYETPSVGLRLAADYMSDSACVHLNWYHHYKSKASDKNSRDRKSSKGLFHTVVYRSINDGPFVGIATLPSDRESYIDRDVRRGETVRYFVKLHLTQYKQSKPSNTAKVTVR